MQTSPKRTCRTCGIGSIINGECHMCGAGVDGPAPLCADCDYRTPAAAKCVAGIEPGGDACLEKRARLPLPQGRDAAPAAGITTAVDDLGHRIRELCEEYLPEGSRVDVSIHLPPPPINVRFSVGDDGVGVPIDPHAQHTGG